MNPNIQQALKHLQNANLKGYFEEMDKVVPDSMQHTFNTHKGIFIAGQAPWDFHQKLELFAEEVDKKLREDLIKPKNNPENQVQTNNPNPQTHTTMQTQNPNHMNPNTDVLFSLLDDAFNDDGLRTFCFNHFPKVHNNFSEGQSKSAKIRDLIEHCQQNLEMDKLLEKIRKEREAMYNKYESELFEGITEPEQVVPDETPELLEAAKGMDKKGLKEEILILIQKDLDAAFDKLDEVFGDINGTYNDFSKEFANPSNNFNIASFRSRLSRFVKTNM